MPTTPCRPNVLILMSDEQSWDTTGATGNPAAVTPHLDALYAESTGFDRAFTPFPLCCPSRASLWTGLMPRHHGILGNWRAIRPELRTAGVAQAYARSGYHTIYTGKWHVPGTTPAAMGWADTSAIPAVLEGRDRGRYIPDYRRYARTRGLELDATNLENLTPADVAATSGPGGKPYATSTIPLDHFLETWQTDAFVRALERRPEDRPWLAACSFNAPHFPMVVPEPYDRIVDRGAVRLPPSLASGSSTRPREVREAHVARDFADLTEADWIEVTAHYLGLVALVDAQVGRIVAALRASGQWDNTIVVFTSDHGDLMGAHGLMEKGHLLHYEPALRVPLVVRHPDIGPARTDNLVSVCDVAPTLAELAGLDWDDERDGHGWHDGRSLVSQLGRGDAAPVRAYVSAETTLADGHAGGHGEPFFPEDWRFPRDALNLSIRTPTTRYVFRSHDEDELFDLAVDPGESVNRAGDPAYRQIRRELRATLADEVADSFEWAAVRLRTDT